MIIGLHGLPGSGKDTICERLNYFTPLTIQPVSFAHKLKKSAAAALGIDMDLMERLKRSDEAAIKIKVGENQWTNMTLRKFLQRYGTEGHRDVFGPDFWVDEALPEWGVYDEDTLYVCTDLRFRNEVDRVKLLGGKVIGVFGGDATMTEHRSDQDLGDDCDFFINNFNRDDDFQLLDAQLPLLLSALGVRTVMGSGTATASNGS